MRTVLCNRILMNRSRSVLASRTGTFRELECAMNNSWVCRKWPLIVLTRLEIEKSNRKSHPTAFEVRGTCRTLKRARIIDLARKIHELARLTTWEFMNMHDSRPHNAVAEVVWARLKINYSRKIITKVSHLHLKVRGTFSPLKKARGIALASEIKPERARYK